MSEKKHYGKDCPKGMVQIEFVGVDPKLKIGEYGYKPSKSAFIEVYVDGSRYRIDVGNITRGDGSTVRGIHINGPIGFIVDRHSINAVDIFTEEENPDTSKNQPNIDTSQGYDEKSGKCKHEE